MTNVLRLGLSRGWIEYWIQALTWQGLLGLLLAPAVLLGVLWLLSGRQDEGVSMALWMLPGFLTLQLVQEGLSGIANKLALDREDGTLLRAKSLPQGMPAYLIARVTVIVMSAFAALMLVLVGGLFLVPGMANIGSTGVLTLMWVLVLGFLAIAPIGAIIGAVVKSPSAAMGLTILPMALIIAISGTFYPLTAVPGISQVFPVYWLGHGLRMALLPDMAAALEIGGAWRPVETALVLGAWAGAGLLLAPGILSRMARRASGSEMEAGRRRYTQRG